MCETDDDYARLVDATRFESYMAALSDVTFSSFAIPLAEDECTALAGAHAAFQEWLPAHSLAPPRRVSCDDPLVDSDFDGWTAWPILEGLARRLQVALVEQGLAAAPAPAPALEAGADGTSLTPLLPPLPPGAFCRLSTISPKDSAPYLPRMALHFADAQRRVQAGDFGDFGVRPAVVGSDSGGAGGGGLGRAGAAAARRAAVNARLYALNLASITACRVTNGREAVQLLAMSGRVAHQVAAALERKDFEGAGQLPPSVIVRAFCAEPRFDPALEFRCFVAHGSVTGITQYNRLIWVPALSTPRGDRDGSAPHPVSTMIERFLIHDVLPRLAAAGVADALGGCVDRGASFIADVILLPRPGGGGVDGCTEAGAGAAWTGNPAPGPVLAAASPAAADGEAAIGTATHRVWLIEINPLAEMAGTGLFGASEWAGLLNPAGRGAAAGPAFRVVEAPLPSADKLVSGPFARFVGTL